MPVASSDSPDFPLTAALWAGFEWVLGYSTVHDLARYHGLPPAVLRRLIGAEDVPEGNIAAFFRWIEASPARRRAWDELEVGDVG